MKRLLERFEAFAMAVAFAEAGEWDTAKQMVEKKNYSYQPAQKKNKKTDSRPRMRV